MLQSAFLSLTTVTTDMYVTTSVFEVLDIDMINTIFFYFQELSIKYLNNASFQRSLEFQMTVQKRLEEAKFGKI